MAYLNDKEAERKRKLRYQRIMSEKKNKQYSAGSINEALKARKAKLSGLSTKY